MEAVTPVVLAGGQGTRLGGVNKALLEIGGQRVIDRLLAALRPLGTPIVIVSNDDSLRGLPDTVVVRDVEPRAGALMGLYSGLRVVRTPLATATACDMPFVSTALLRVLLALAEGVDAVVPVIGEQPEPLHAVYRPSCLPAIEAALAAGRKRLLAFFEAVRVRYVPEAELRRWDPELRSFLNVNWPDDLARARALGA
ncbi:MAG TPA: molybdenum cofactor guanylyltransferase [Chloroflexota bacterium]|nr:molybdenum cofactor guanylyltransferase [Chloroflexota bacterium]